jgi:hypothetical protein
VRRFRPWQAIIAMPTSVMIDTIYFEAMRGNRIHAIRKTISQTLTNQV